MTQGSPLLNLLAKVEAKIRKFKFIEAVPIGKV